MITFPEDFYSHQELQWQQLSSFFLANQNPEKQIYLIGCDSGATLLFRLEEFQEQFSALDHTVRDVSRPKIEAGTGFHSPPDNTERPPLLHLKHVEYYTWNNQEESIELILTQVIEEAESYPVLIWTDLLSQSWFTAHPILQHDAIVSFNFYEQDLEKAQQNLESLLAISPLREAFIKDVDLARTIDLSKALAKQDLSRAGSSILEQHSSIAEEATDQDTFHEYFLLWGDILVLDQDYFGAIDKYQLVQQSYSEIGNKALIASTHVRIARTYAMIGQIHSAIDHYQYAIEAWWESHNIREIGVSYYQMGLLAERQNNFMHAEEYYQDAIHQLSQAEAWEALTISYIQLGKLYYRQQELQQAEEQFLKSQAYAKKAEKPELIRLADDQVKKVEQHTRPNISQEAIQQEEIKRKEEEEKQRKMGRRAFLNRFFRRGED